jgi:hypothetical protein
VDPPAGHGGSAASAATPIVEIPDLAVLSYACNRQARTFATQIAVPRGGATVRVTRLSPRRMPPERLQPGERKRTLLAAASRERWELRSVTEPATTTAHVKIAYASRPKTRDCVVKVLHVDVRTRSHAP